VIERVFEGVEALFAVPVASNLLVVFYASCVSFQMCPYSLHVIAQAVPLCHSLSCQLLACHCAGCVSSRAVAACLPLCHLLPCHLLACHCAGCAIVLFAAVSFAVVPFACMPLRRLCQLTCRYSLFAIVPFACAPLCHLLPCHLLPCHCAGCVGSRAVRAAGGANRKPAKHHQAAASVQPG